MVTGPACVSKCNNLDSSTSDGCGNHMKMPSEHMNKQTLQSLQHSRRNVTGNGEIAEAWRDTFLWWVIFNKNSLLEKV